MRERERERERERFKNYKTVMPFVSTLVQTQALNLNFNFINRRRRRKEDILEKFVYNVTCHRLKRYEDFCFFQILLKRGSLGEFKAQKIEERERERERERKI